MALENTDLLVVQRPDTKQYFKIEFNQLSEEIFPPGDLNIDGNITATGDITADGFVYGDGRYLTNLSLPNTLLFEGNIDITQPAPVGVEDGDFYLNTVEGNPHSDFVGDFISATDVIAVNQFVYKIEAGWVAGSVQDSSGFVTLNTEQTITGDKTLSGAITASGQITVGVNVLTTAGDPTDDNHYVRKSYVDQGIENIVSATDDMQGLVELATTAEVINADAQGTDGPLVVTPPGMFAALNSDSPEYQIDCGVYAS